MAGVSHASPSVAASALAALFFLLHQPCCALPLHPKNVTGVLAVKRAAKWMSQEVDVRDTAVSASTWAAGVPGRCRLAAPSVSVSAAHTG